jgi:endonuclease-8
MPEGPEVRREADRIGSALLGSPLEDVEFGLPRLARFEKILTGTRVIEVETRGKAMLTHFDNDLSMYSHNQLYGKWLVRKRGKLPPTNRSLRVGLHTDSHSAILYSASEIEILERRLLEEHPFLKKLGPDVLSSTLSWREIAERLQAPGFTGRSLASLYLDQGFLAGVGNYMRSEILHEAALNPFVRAKALSRGERGRLARATLLISERAYQKAGVTNAPGRVRTLKCLGYPRRDYRFAAFAREDLPCYQCDEKIRRVEVSARRLYYCPKCQAET